MCSFRSIPYALLFCLSSLKDLKNLKEKLEAQIAERDNTIETQRKKINGLVSSGTSYSKQEQIVNKRTPLSMSPLPLATPTWASHVASEVGHSGVTRSFLCHMTTTEIDPNRKFVTKKSDFE